MCEFCVKHGEGKKWYLNVKNYSDDLWNDIQRKKTAREHFGLIAHLPNREFKLYKFIYSKFPFLGLMLLRRFKEQFKRKHLGQVVPIEDVEKILSIANSIVRIPCICRNSTTGKNIRYCFAISIDPASIGMAQFIDSGYFKGPDISNFEKFDKEKALQFMKGLEPTGIIHTVWTVLTPFVGFLCNCGHDGCIPMMSYREITPITMKSEYVAEVNYLTCSVCKECVKLCPFNAITFNGIDRKVIIDSKKCYGCGICRSVCKKDAILLVDRSKISDVANVWE